MNRRWQRTEFVTIALMAVIGFSQAQEPESTPPEAMTLQEAIEFAIAHHPQVKIAEETVVQAKANLTRAIGALLPQLTLNGSFTYNGKLPRQVLDFGGEFPFGGGGDQEAEPPAEGEEPPLEDQEGPVVEAPETRNGGPIRN
ncbi:MAG: hypothetical protein KatS3mg115_1774 [Candidatus Poribacteria bacterium]|nr:MAG: hypothetical protein KatS3mg115_1774 [Candidatus Poribacteria bacterium]